MNVTIEGAKRVSVRLANLGPNIRTLGRRELGLIGEHLGTYYREHFEDSGLHVRSGDMKRSGTAMPVEEDANSLRGGLLVGQGLPYAPMQEFGGTIVPVRAQFLTIPIGEALTPSGVARFSAPEAESAGYKTFVRGHILYGVKDGQLYPLFILATSVTIPARPTAGPTLDANRTWIEGRLKNVVDEAIKGGA